MQLWLNNGAQLAWLIDPIDENVVVYRPDHPPELLDHPEIIVGTQPVFGFELRCSRFWSPRWRISDELAV